MAKQSQLIIVVIAFRCATTNSRCKKMKTKETRVSRLGRTWLSLTARAAEGAVAPPTQRKEPAMRVEDSLTPRDNVCLRNDRVTRIKRDVTTTADVPS